MASADDQLLVSMKKLDSLYQSPRLFIADYFISLRLEIDIRTETLLAALGPDDNEEYDDLNAAREFMIDTLSQHEKKCVENRDYEVPDPGRLGSLIEKVNADRLEEEISRLSLQILLGKSFVFEGFAVGGSKLGLLLCFERWLPSDAETEWIK